MDGEPWFVLADLCKVLEMKNASDLKKRLNSDDVNTLDLSEGISKGNPNVKTSEGTGLFLY